MRPIQEFPGKSHMKGQNHVKPQTPPRQVQVGMMALALVASTGPLVAQKDASPDQRPRQVRDSADPPPIPLPKRRSQQPHHNPPPSPPGAEGGSSETALPDEFRRIDGVDNNVANPVLGSSEQPYHRRFDLPRHRELQSGLQARVSGRFPSGSSRTEPPNVCHQLICLRIRDLLSRWNYEIA